MMTPPRSQRTSPDDEDRECVGAVLMVQIVYELFTEVFCLPSFGGLRGTSFQWRGVVFLSLLELNQKRRVPSRIKGG